MKGGLDPYRAIDRQRQPESYVEHLEKRGRTPSQARLRHRFLRFVKVASGQRLLEVGSGTGIVARDVATLTGPRGRVIGVDPSRVMTEAARRLARPRRSLLRLFDRECVPRSGWLWLQR